VTDLVEVAFVGDEAQAAMIQALLEEHEIPSLQQQVTPSGPQLGYGLLNPGGGARRLMVRPEHADRARVLIEATKAEEEQTAPETINARYLEEVEAGRGPRNYGVIGAYARAYLVAFAVFALFFVIWMLNRLFF